MSSVTLTSVVHDVAESVTTSLLPSIEDVRRLSRNIFQAYSPPAAISSTKNRWLRLVNPDTGSSFGYHSNAERASQLLSQFTSLRTKNDKANTKEESAIKPHFVYDTLPKRTPTPVIFDTASKSAHAPSVTQGLLAGSKLATQADHDVPLTDSRSILERRVFLEDLAMFHTVVLRARAPYPCTEEKRLGEVDALDVMELPHGVCLYSLYSLCIQKGGFECLYAQSDKLPFSKLLANFPIDTRNWQLSDSGIEAYVCKLYQRIVYPLEMHFGTANQTSEISQSMQSPQADQSLDGWCLPLSDVFREELGAPLFPMSKNQRHNRHRATSNVHESTNKSNDKTRQRRSTICSSNAADILADNDPIPHAGSMATPVRAGLLRLRKRTSSDPGSHRSDSSLTSKENINDSPAVNSLEYVILGIYGQGGADAPRRLRSLLSLSSPRETDHTSHLAPAENSEKMDVSLVRKLMCEWAKEAVHRFQRQIVGLIPAEGQGHSAQHSMSIKANTSGDNQNDIAVSLVPLPPDTALERGTPPVDFVPAATVAAMSSSDHSSSSVAANSRRQHIQGTLQHIPPPTGSPPHDHLSSRHRGFSIASAAAGDLLLFLRNREGTQDELWSPETTHSDGESNSHAHISPPPSDGSPPARSRATFRPIFARSTHFTGSSGAEYAFVPADVNRPLHPVASRHTSDISVHRLPRQRSFEALGEAAPNTRSSKRRRRYHSFDDEATQRPLCVNTSTHINQAPNAMTVPHRMHQSFGAHTSGQIHNIDVEPSQTRGTCVPLRELLPNKASQQDSHGPDAELVITSRGLAYYVSPDAFTPSQWVAEGRLSHLLLSPSCHSKDNGSSPQYADVEAAHLLVAHEHLHTSAGDTSSTTNDGTDSWCDLSPTSRVPMPAGATNTVVRAPTVSNGKLGDSSPDSDLSPESGLEIEQNIDVKPELPQLAQRQQSFTRVLDANETPQTIPASLTDNQFGSTSNETDQPNGSEYTSDRSSAQTAQFRDVWTSAGKFAVYTSTIRSETARHGIPGAVARLPFRQSCQDGSNTAVLYTSTLPTFERVRVPNQSDQYVSVRPLATRRVSSSRMHDEVNTSQAGEPQSSSDIQQDILLQLPPIVAVDRNRLTTTQSALPTH